MQDIDIKPRYEHSKLGNFMFFLCAKATKFFVKHRIIYYFLNYTWGILMTLIGLLVSFPLFIAYLFTDKLSFQRYKWIYCVKIGPDYWGGCDLGQMFIRDQKSGSSLDAHEFGHTFQNGILGPLMPFLVSIPSATRWWYRYLKYDRKGKSAPKAYDAIWFEDAASRCGEYAARLIGDK